VGSKLTGFAASIGFGLVYGFTDRPRDGIIVIFVQLVAGWLLLARIPMDGWRGVVRNRLRTAETPSLTA
jgi:MFS-type transporter involved in bile tolerance (Atg22 family)